MGIINSPIIEVAIGLVLLYLVVGLICTAVNELVAQAFNLRADMLWDTVRTLLHDSGGENAAKDLYNHSLIRSLAVRAGTLPNAGGDDPNARAKPSYIPASLFSLALIDLIAPRAADSKAAGPPTPKELIGRLPQSGLPGPLQSALAPLLNSTAGTIEKARENIESWYNAAMDRATGWYKRRIQKITLYVAFLIVFFANADSLQFANRLWANPVERAQLVEAARKMPAPAAAPGGSLPTTNSVTPAAGTTAAAVDGPVTLPPIPPEMRELLGWAGPVDPYAATYNPEDPRRFPRGTNEWVIKLLGLLVTTFAATLGAPFWFDVLNKIINIRSTGPSPNETAKQPAK